jgi:hypothetical protein
MKQGDLLRFRARANALPSYPLCGLRSEISVTSDKGFRKKTIIKTRRIEVFMDLFLFGHGPRNGESDVLSEPMRAWLQNQNIERCVVFTTTDKAYTALLDEIASVAGSESLHVESHPLQLISTKTATKPSDVQKQPWEVLTEIAKHVDDGHESVLLCGRSNALYDHLFWLVSQCLPNTTLLNMDTACPALPLHHESIGGDVSPNTIAAMLICHLEDLMKGRLDVENNGFADAARLGNMFDAGQVSGIQSALAPYVSRNMVQRTEVSENSVTYKILPDGLGEACSHWWRQRPVINEHAKTLNIVFGRLPHLSTTNEKGEYSSFDSFFEFMSPLQPVDGLLSVIQRHDEAIEGNHVLTLDEAVEMFEDKDLGGDLKHCKSVLDRRSREDRIQTNHHLVVINPIATPEFHHDVIMTMLRACLEFERKHGERVWTVDLTEPLSPLRSAVSFFSFVFRANTTYIMKDIGEGDEESKLRRRDLAIPVPNSTAFSAMSRLTGGHGNNKGASNLIIALLLSEAKKVNTADLSELDPFDTTLNLEAKEHGLLKKEIQFFVEEELASHLDLSAGVLEQFDRTVRDYMLIEQGLVHAERPPKKAATHTRYSLTFLGKFVGEQLLRIREKEVGN